MTHHLFSLLVPFYYAHIIRTNGRRNDPMKWKKVVIAAAAALILSMGESGACTLWAAAGDAAGGGAIIAKNRDWYPNHRQVLKTVHPDGGYAYMGIYAENKKVYSGFKAGINEKGLSIVNASASAIPRAERMKMGYTWKVMEHVLAQCATVEEALSLLDRAEGPRFLLLADREEITQVEIGPYGLKRVERKRNGTLHHTNHYKEFPFTAFNELPGKSSHVRDRRIGEILGGRPSWTMDEFIAVTADHAAGADDSIFRTGSTKKSEKTIASWVARIPPEGAPEIYVRLLNPKEPVREVRLTGDALFDEK